MTQPARLPGNEADRLAALRRLEVLDSAPEPAFEALVRAASLVCGTPISLISLVDADRQWFKANIGLPGASETPRDIAFCAHAVLDSEVFEVADATQDSRFAQNPLVTSSPDIRFYAGMPLTMSDGHRVGTLCVIDRVPRELSATQREVLQCLGVAAAKALETRRALIQEEHYRALTEMSPLGVFSTNAKGAFTYTNERWQQIHGMPAVRALDDGWSDALHPEDRKAVIEYWQRCGRLQAEFNKEFRLRRSDGTVHMVRARARPVLDDLGRTQSYVGSVEDITESRALLDRLSASQDEVRALYESTPALLHSVDPAGLLLTVSDRWLSTLGYTRSEVIGKPSFLFLTEASRQHAKALGWPMMLAEGHVSRLPYLSRPGWFLTTFLNNSGRLACQSLRA
jgi:diguanylate cyclase